MHQRANIDCALTSSTFSNTSIRNCVYYYVILLAFLAVTFYLFVFSCWLVGSLVGWFVGWLAGSVGWFGWLVRSVGRSVVVACDIRIHIIFFLVIKPAWIPFSITT